MSSDCALIIFAKYPQEGKVKTRLARDTGEDFATHFYRNCAEYVFSEALKLDKSYFSSFVYCFDEREVEMVSAWLEKNIIVMPQVKGNLGERMCASFRDVFGMGFSRAIIIGTDVPDIKSDIIQRAAEMLNKCDFVLGPSSDGGYYLLGMKRLIEEIFEDIAWSTSLVLKDTLNKISLLELEANLLEELIDIDNMTALKNWFKNCRDLSSPIYKFVDEYNQKLKKNLSKK